LLPDGVSIDITFGGWRESSRQLVCDKGIKCGSRARLGSALVSLEIFVVLTAVAARASIAWRNPQLIQGRAR
jgi:hypothetical protein